jgi:NADH pyrophosphatase NudC (nudix superfamily)
MVGEMNQSGGEGNQRPTDLPLEEFLNAFTAAQAQASTNNQRLFDEVLARLIANLTQETRLLLEVVKALQTSGQTGQPRVPPEIREAVERYKADVRSRGGDAPEIVGRGLVVCSKCQALNGQGSRFCDQCGADLPQERGTGPLACPSCGTMNMQYARFCKQCGIEQLPRMEPTFMLCPSCGELNDLDSEFCIQCGVALLKQALQETSN